MNGGPALTPALLANSPARNAAVIDQCPEHNQQVKSRDTSFLLPIIAAN